MMTKNIILFSIVTVLFLACANEKTQDSTTAVVREEVVPSAKVEPTVVAEKPTETTENEPIASIEKPIEKSAVAEKTSKKVTEQPVKKPVKVAPTPKPTKVVTTSETPTPEPVNTTIKSPSTIIEKNIEQPSTPVNAIATPKAIEVPKKEVIQEVVEAPKAEPVKTPPPAPKPPFSHDVWNNLLRKNVSVTGQVNYKGFKAEKNKLESYLAALASNTPQSDWSKAKTMAYWINTYNAFTVKLIVDNYPVGSITDLEGGKPWSKKWIKLGNSMYSLDQIEKEILLKKYKDARVHFAVNCAAKSCPALLNKAWTASNLEANFERQTKAFINNSQFNDIRPKSANVSQLFNWYADDFGDLKAFINRYSTIQLKSNAKINFMEYNWNLNE